MLDGLDLELMADLIAQISSARTYGDAQAFPENPPMVSVVIPVLMSHWDRAEPIMTRVIPSLPYVISVTQLDHIDGSECHRGWRVDCRG